MIRLDPAPAPVRANVRAPGSKYEANRLLLIAALTDGTTHLTNVPEGEDVHAAATAIEALGAQVRRRTRKEIEVKGLPPESGSIPPDPVSVEVGESGTLFRFLTAAAATVPRPIRITGRGRIGERPIAGLVRTLECLGARIETRDGFAPIGVLSGRLRGGRVRVRADETSQFASALLLASPRADGPVEVELDGGSVSRPYLDLTIRMMERCGVRVAATGDGRFRVPPGARYRPGVHRVSGDWTAASYFLAAGALGSGPDGTPGEIEVHGLDPDSPQGERRFPDLLRRMGCEVSEDETAEGFAVRLTGARELCGIEVDMGGLPDAVPTLAGLAPFAVGPTQITGVAHLRHKESDRLAALADGLTALGAGVETGAGSLTVRPRALRPATLDPVGDHRIAMALALAGLRVPGVRVRSPEVVGKSFPGFWRALAGLGVSVTPEPAVA